MDKIKLTLKPFTLHFLLTCLFLCLLTSCSSHVSRPDGAPNFYVDETRIPNAVPKCEPRAKYGNMSFYRVFGKSYYVMPSCKNYEEYGVASWYGTKFHSRRTSSGEPYNMLGMTAAHKTLPLPTYVEVTNMKNHRTIIVKVNDRGPFSSNRIIDLSYVAAKKLGMLGRGTAYVRVRAIDPVIYGKNVIPAKAGTSHRPIIVAQHHRKKEFRGFVPVQDLNAVSVAQNRHVYLQVGAFRSRANALKLKQRLANLVAMPIKITYPSARINLYRVQVGPIKDYTMVNKLSHQLKKLGIKPNQVDGA